MVCAHTGAIRLAAAARGAFGGRPIDEGILPEKTIASLATSGHSYDVCGARMVSNVNVLQENLQRLEDLNKVMKLMSELERIPVSEACST